MNDATDALQSEPVFVDPTGRRSAIVRGLGIVAGCLLGGYIAIVTFGLATGTDVPLTPWPQIQHSTRDATPGHGGRGRRPSKPAAPGPIAGARPSGTGPAGTAPRATTSPKGTGTAAPGRTATGSPAASTTPTSATTPTTAATRPGKGVGRTKKPQPKVS